MISNIFERELIPLNEFLLTHAISRTQAYREINAGRLCLTKRGSRSFIDRKDAAAWRNALPKKEVAHEA